MSNNNNHAEPYTSDLLRHLVEQVQDYFYMPDPAPFLLALATVVANRIPGPATWLMIVGPPGSGKSDILHTITGLPKVHVIGSFTEASLLSATTTKNGVSQGTGGILRRMGAEGVLAANDFTTVLAMSRDQRSAVLAAMREIHDGHWVRHVGYEGGRMIQWEGRCGFIGAVTDVIDSYHAVIAALGDRFLYYRMPNIAPLEIANKVSERVFNNGHHQLEDIREQVMGAEDYLNIDAEPVSVDRKWLDLAARIGGLGRSAVERDSYHHTIGRVIRPELPGRLAEGLSQLFMALRLIGCAAAEIRRLVMKVASDAIPMERTRLIRYLNDKPDSQIDMAMREDLTDAYRLLHPESEVRRNLEDMECLDMVERHRQATTDHWRLTATFKSTWHQFTNHKVVAK